MRAILLALAAVLCGCGGRPITDLAKPVAPVVVQPSAEQLADSALRAEGVIAEQVESLAEDMAHIALQECMKKEWPLCAKERAALSEVRNRYATAVHAAVGIAPARERCSLVLPEMRIGGRCWVYIVTPSQGFSDGTLTCNRSLLRTDRDWWLCSEPAR